MKYIAINFICTVYFPCDMNNFHPCVYRVVLWNAKFLIMHHVISFSSTAIPSLMFATVWQQFQHKCSRGNYTENSQK